MIAIRKDVPLSCIVALEHFPVECLQKPWFSLDHHVCKPSLEIFIVQLFAFCSIKRF